jgi:uncharacterized protein (DUF305 family)
MGHDRQHLPIFVTPNLRFLAVPAVLAATLALTSCGPTLGGAPNVRGTGTPQSPQTATRSATATPTGAGTPARGKVGAPDVGFATMMIPQDTQVVTMANLALKEATSAKIKAFAPKLKKAAVPEVARMSGWFTSVGGVAPGTAGYHDMSTMPGMKKADNNGALTAKDMAGLTAAKGTAFDRMWLKLMVRNRRGAVAMARVEIATGGSPDVKAVAQEIIDAEPAKIAELTAILAEVTG